MSLSRRAFVVGSAGAMATLSTRSWARVPGANASLRLGLIGAGGRGRYVASIFQKQPDVQLVAVCDVFDRNRDQMIASAPGAKPYTDYRALLDDKGVDAVLVATPDHWHSAIAVDAMRAGKDVYVEKPLAHSAEEGRRIVRAQKETNRVVQVGLQQRSGPHYLEAKREFVDSKRIGKIVYARTWWNANFARVVRPPFTERPAGLDWKQWLGPAKMRPFDPKMVVSWRGYFDFGGGMTTDLFTHWIDVAHWYVGEELPNAASSQGGIYQYPDGRDAPDTVNVLLDYPGGWTASFSGSVAPGATGAGVELLGTEGTLYIDRSRYTFTPAGKDAPPVTVPWPTDQTIEHVQNFVSCVQSRKTPNSDVVSGFRSCLATLAGKQAYVEKRRVAMDPERDRATSAGE